MTETLELLDENKGKKFLDIGLGTDILDLSLLDNKTKGLHHLKSFYTAK